MDLLQTTHGIGSMPKSANSIKLLKSLMFQVHICGRHFPIPVLSVDV